MTISDHQHSIRQYRSDTLEKIAADLLINPKRRIAGSWEQTRFDAIKAELKKRRKAL